MAGDIVLCPEHFCADQTIIQERSHTLRQHCDSSQLCLKSRSSERRICLCLLERGWVDFGIVDTSCSWLVLHRQQSQSASSSSLSQHPRGSRNWRAIKEALKRGDCQHDCLRFLAVKEWKHRSGCIKDTANSSGNTFHCVLCATRTGIWVELSLKQKLWWRKFFFQQTKDYKNNMSHIRKN